MATTSLINILNLTPVDLKDRFKALGLEAYRADQVLEWIYGKGVYDFDRMTNLSKDLKDKLKAFFAVLFPEEVREARSHQDKSVKLLLKLKDGDLIETVYMSAAKRDGSAARVGGPMEHRRTVCVSSQVGCKFHCAFCASGQNGFFRNLTMGEIMAQILMARDLSPEKKITNIVFMGIGEPFDNYTELLRTVRTLNAKKGLGLGARKITISTCGVVPKIESLSNEGLQIELSVSLHGASDRVRETIMPVNRAYPVKALLDACKRYIKKTKRAITFEYILIKGINASEKDARELTKVLKGMLCKVNLIPYNPIEEFPHDQPAYPEIVRFQKILQEAGIRTTVRFSKGRDIQAACGQLRSVIVKQAK